MPKNSSNRKALCLPVTYRTIYSVKNNGQKRVFSFSTRQIPCGFAGAPRMNVLILGCGVVGQGALEVLHALGANCTVMDINVGVLRKLLTQYNSSISTMLCNKETIASVLPQTDMVLNCVKWPKERKDFLIDKQMLPMIMSILKDGVAECCVRDGYYRRSLTAYKGYLTHEETRVIQNKPWIKPEDILEIADRRLDPAPAATVTRSNNFYK